MNKIILSLLFPVFAWAQTSNTSFAIIPQPVNVQIEKGTFEFSSSVKVKDEGKRFTGEIEVFNQQLKQITGYPLAMNGKKKANPVIELVYADELTHEEAYEVTISANAIRIRGNNQGVFYGLQSVLQLVGAYQTTQSKLVQLPCAVISDYPRYTWRGMHLDVSRHFFTKEEVKRYIDFLALYKMNVFHWHLTDDQDGE
jgi:hexosaminidase